MLETLADHDDELMEQLLEDIPPPRDKVFDDLARELREGQACPVLIGVATRTNGVLRLAEGAAARGAECGDRPAKRLGVTGRRCHRLCGQDHQHLAWRQDVGRARARGPDRRRHHAQLAGPRCRPRLRRVQADGPGASRSAAPAAAGETVAFGKLDHARTGDTLAAGKDSPKRLVEIVPYPPVLAISIAAKERKDDVKLGQALNKLVEEDPSITIVHNPDTHEVILWGQGEMHLRVIAERLTDRFGIAIEKRQPSVGYRETIKKTIQQRGRHKKQSGGHGQFGDVVLDIKPLPRGSGFSFAEKITGGVVPRNYIPSVEEGVIDGLKHGPLGFPVVDIAVTLIDGSYPHRRFLRHGVPHRRPHRRRGSAAAMPSGAAGADPFGRDRLSE